jgi:hypothetical protein
VIEIEGETEIEREAKGGVEAEREIERWIRNRSRNIRRRGWVTELDPTTPTASTTASPARSKAPGSTDPYGRRSDTAYCLEDTVYCLYCLYCLLLSLLYCLLPTTPTTTASPVRSKAPGCTDPYHNNRHNYTAHKH